MADRVGQQIDNYRLIRLLGTGGFGEVYLAEHVYRKTQVAVKVLPKLASDDMQGFLTEARTFRLRHPHIVQVLDFGVEERIPFIVMEYMPNGTLRQRHPRGTQVPLPTIVSYVQQVAGALQYAHEDRLIHRDVKPENMLLNSSNDLLLSDFGIATIAHGTASQSTQVMTGTISYMAPEQINAHARPASDQYSLGVVVYEWLSGELPFAGSMTEVAIKHMVQPPPPLHEKVPTISPDVEQVVLTALAKDPKQRFGTVQAFATALEQASQSQPSQVLPTSPSVHPVDSMPHLRSAPTPTEHDIPTELITSPVESVIPPEQISSPSTASTTPLNQAVVPPTEVALPTQEMIPGSDATTPSNGAAIKSSDSSLHKQTPGVKRNNQPEEEPYKSRRHSRKQTPGNIMAILLVIMVCGGIIFGIIYGIYASNQASIGAATATSTTIAQKNATDIAQIDPKNATNIAQIDPTVAASHPDPYPPTNAKLTLYDPMSDNSNKGYGWEETTFDDGSKCQFGNFGYDVSSPTGGMFCYASNTGLKNFAFEVQMTINVGNCGGIMFRYNTSGANQTYYETDFCQDGSYDLFTPNSNGYLVSGTTLHMQTGLGQSNIIAIVADGDILNLYANQQKIASTKDDSFNHGSIGVLAYNDSNKLCDVLYHNAKVWTF